MCNQFAYCGDDFANPIFIQPKNTAMAKRYIKMLDRDIAAALKSLDTRKGLINVNIPDNAVFSDSAVERLSIKEKKKIAEDPKYIWSYQQSRSTAQLASALAYAYSMKQSQYYRSPLILNYIKKIFWAFSKHQSESGEFVFSPIHYSTVWGTHEMAWRLEPLICAFVNVQSELSQSVRDSCHVLLDRAMQFLLTHENSSLSNRGVVWCGVMALCYRFTGEQKYLDAANRVFYWVGRLFNADGEIREGPGPDLVYSTVSLQYLFLYRIMSGDKSLDPILLKSLNWYTRLFTSNAIPLEGMTTRQWLMGGDIVSSVLSLLTFYGDKYPSFTQIANHYLDALEKMKGGFTLSHSSAYFLRGAQYHVMTKKIEPIPYKSYSQLYHSDHSLYFVCGNNYQTAVTLRGRKPMKGLQTWSYKGQPPLIFPTQKNQSHAKGFGFDSHLMDVPWDVSPKPYRLSTLENGTNVLMAATGSLTTAYLFTEDVTVVVYHSKNNKMLIEWVNYVPMCAKLDKVTDQEILFKNSTARIIFEGKAPSIIRKEDTAKFHFVYDKRYCWFAFAGPNSDVKVKQTRQGLIVVSVHDKKTTTNIIINMSAEETSTELDLDNLKITKFLQPYEARLIQSDWRIQ